jgi:preprotein translocase subunit SecA
MVTRAVENAQRKVEAMHFESRKHLLEYDDVANAQRQVIYKHRREVLDNNFNLKEKIHNNIQEVLDEIFIDNNIVEGMPKEDFNLEGLSKEIFEYSTIEFELNELNNKDGFELKEYVEKKLIDEYEKKMSVLDEEKRDEIERVLYLQVLDESWREHLYQMDILKTGIGLRGYNQKDPLVEYKKESFDLFNELIYRIKKESTKTLFMVRFTFEDPKAEEEAIQRMKEFMEFEANEKISELHQGASTSTSELKPHRAQKKIPRNAPCPCGSGKKYKHCCGRSGPKKGLLAQNQ